MIEPIAKALTREAFAAYVADELPGLMKLWRPRGIVAHNMGPPRLDQFYVDTFHGDKPMTGAQRVKNTWESYRRQGWSGGPHLFITDKEIILANPLWLPGVHATFWGFEMPGDYDVETFPDALRDMAVFACATLYAALGHEPTPDTFHLHKEDPRTLHKRCPGKNAGPKADWIKAIADRMAALHPGNCACGGHADPVGGLAKKAKAKAA